jgi:hypothetical protein
VTGKIGDEITLAGPAPRNLVAGCIFKAEKGAGSVNEHAASIRLTHAGCALRLLDGNIVGIGAHGGGGGGGGTILSCVLEFTVLATRAPLNYTVTVTP